MDILNFYKEYDRKGRMFLLCVHLPHEKHF